MAKYQRQRRAGGRNLRLGGVKDECGERVAARNIESGGGS